MSYYEIQGGRPLSGALAVHGAKNSVLPILAACLLVSGQNVIHNCPDLSDVSATLDILRLLGCRVEREEDTVTIDASGLNRWDIPEYLMREMRSSVIFLGALLARLGTAELSYPGGCELGPRPIDLHLSTLRALGAEILEEQGALCCRGRKKSLQGREVCLPIPSVGATENAMLAACGCPGLTTIVGAAQEPEIVDLQNFLQAMGAQVRGAGTPTVSIQGGVPLHPARYRVMGDRIAAATYLCAAAAAQGEVELTGVSPDTLTAVLACLKEAGCVLRTGSDRIALTCVGPLRGISAVRTAPYPGFPTDAQAILMAALAGGEGATLFEENIFASRYRHVDELRRMGADIQLAGRAAMVSGVGRLHGAAVRSTDLRGGAALVVAALGAEGTTQVSELRHIRRGYQNLDRNLRSLGAEIREIP
ncbi:MAG: UDP-N-acetylglucosamine 1-carboxyvinyltransferase [Lawsonibacter sp.]|nr:UDP-N-acetylglucosamine 1-carboxyvinyltransferase [Lawsonibacter sp.]